ncbi:hypothetical protein CC86DRAFT_385571 [Ophiobolus disseminans]|uniref:Uncharacterized protein n=1 Tax=Ophiobolus disseminans TaxID=1469910 RepID=A0A6A6ZP52_9PLEO|nr:hypothetical protein CC86DRAFT_385571 [Ophiobolus disseminans]
MCIRYQYQCRERYCNNLIGELDRVHLCQAIIDLNQKRAARGFGPVHCNHEHRIRKKSRDRRCPACQRIKDFNDEDKQRKLAEAGRALDDLLTKSSMRLARVVNVDEVEPGRGGNQRSSGNVHGYMSGAGWQASTNAAHKAYSVLSRLHEPEPATTEK